MQKLNAADSQDNLYRANFLDYLKGAAAIVSSFKH